MLYAHRSRLRRSHDQPLSSSPGESGAILVVSAGGLCSFDEPIIQRIRVMLESDLFSFLENTADAAFAVTEQGEIRFWNKSAEKLFGYPAAEAKGKTCFDLLHGTGALGTPVCHENCSVLECTGNSVEVPNFDLSATRRSGERLWVNLSTLVFNNQRTGQRLLVHLAHDITEQKKQDEVVRQVLALSKELASLGERIGRSAPVSPLSAQEIEILKLFASGNSPAKIAKKLGISSQTLRNHLHHINQKLRTHNRLEAVMHAMQRKLI
jgi:PAS domain S-box-containing protein